MRGAVVILAVVVGVSSAVYVDLTKIKECNGYLDFRPLFDKREEDLQFYMQTTAKSEQDCIHMCYEKLHFCYTVMYKERHDEPNADGICYFGYYRPDNCDISGSGGSGSGSGSGIVHLESQTQPNSQAENGAKISNAKIYTCIACKENPPSFIQDVDENRLGPAQLIKPADHPITKPPHDQVSNQTSTPTELSHVLYLRESKAFSYLMPKCPGQLSYGIQATLMNRKPKIYAATNETSSVEECAHFCYRQHFCASAFYFNDNCLLSYETTECSDITSLPTGYTGSILISCIECKKSS